MEVPTTSVTVGLTYKTNLGNYESMNIMISVTDHKKPNESTSDTTERIYNYVESELIKRTKQLKAEVDQIGK